MGTPTATSINGQASQEWASADGNDPRVANMLSELDGILSTLTRNDRAAMERHAVEADDQRRFLDEFETACTNEIRPAMAAVLHRLEAGGGGGSVEEHPGGEARYLTPRLTLWMSLEGPIEGVARPDKHPYLQFDAEVERREVRVSEGDMWHGAGGGRSGPVGNWQLAEITHDRIIEEVLGIVRRAAMVPITDGRRNDSEPGTPVPS